MNFLFDSSAENCSKQQGSRERKEILIPLRALKYLSSENAFLKEERLHRYATGARDGSCQDKRGRKDIGLKDRNCNAWIFHGWALAQCGGDYVSYVTASTRSDTREKSKESRFSAEGERFRKSAGRFLFTAPSHPAKLTGKRHSSSYPSSSPRVLAFPLPRRRQRSLLLLLLHKRVEKEAEKERIPSTWPRR